MSMRAGLLMAAAAFFSWGLLTPVGKILLEDLEPMSLNAVRMVVGTLMLMAIVPRHLWREGLLYLRRKEVFILGLLGGGIDFTLYIYALKYVDATFATLGFYTAPLWTALMARAFLGERLGAWFVPAVAVLLGGGYLTLFGLAGVGDGFHLGGMALATASGFGWGVYAVGLRKYAPGLRLRPLMVASFVVSTAWFILIGLIFEGVPPILELSAPAWLWMILHAAVPTTLALFLFNASLQRAPAGYVNVLVGIELAATVLFSYLLLGDTFTAWQMAGLAAALLAVSGYLWERARRGRIDARAPAAGAV